MGYDCTLHVIDGQIIRERFVPRVLGKASEDSKFDQRSDSEELWASLEESIVGLETGEVSPRDCANTISQLAIAYSAAELPYHFERGFCLSLWEDQEEGFFANFPKKHRGNPETLFKEIVQRYPKLKGIFPSEIESNFYPGVFIPADKVPAALKWAKRKVQSFEKPNRRLFRGLLLVLKEATDRGLSYWEGTDLPVPATTIAPPECERDESLKVWVNSEEIHMDFLWRDGPTFAFTHGIGFPQDCRTALIDITSWPPTTNCIWEEFSLSASSSRSGKWVTVSMTSDHEFLYRARLRASVDSEPVELLPPVERDHGLSWAGFLGEQVIAAQRADTSCFLTKHPNPNGIKNPAPIYMQKSDRLITRETLPPSHQEFPISDMIQMEDEIQVFIWDLIGYEFRSNELQPAYKLPSRSVGEEAMSFVPFGTDSFFCVCDLAPLHPEEVADEFGAQGLFFIRRDSDSVRHLPKIKRIEAITPGPNNSVIVIEPWNRPDLGKLYFPEEETYVRLETDLFEDEDPTYIRSLHYVSQCERLIAVTPDRIWARPISEILELPRYNAASGRKRRKR